MAREPDQVLHDGIFQSATPQHVPPGKIQKILKKTWKPWHMPRKQWIRLRQWNVQIGQLIDALNLVDRPLRYLSLPGEDFLDIRVVRELCERKSVHLKCLGFDNGTYLPKTETERNISKNEVFQSSIIYPGSDVKKDDFARISDENSQAYKVAKHHGPYDIINLDLCGSFSRRQGRPYYDALCNLIDIQIKERSQPWMFFLTTRADVGQVNTNDLPNYWRNLRYNVLRSDIFKDRLESLLGDHFEHINGNLQQELIRLERTKFGRLFALCIAKWLLRLMSSGSPLWVTEMLDSYWYRVSYAKAPNMLSLSFRFRQVTDTRQDPTGLAETRNPQNVQVDEAELAISALTKTESLVDIDRLLIENPALYNKMVEESKKLLGSARYLIKDYPRWAETKQKSMIRKLRN